MELNCIGRQLVSVEVEWPVCAEILQDLSQFGPSDAAGTIK
jgi:hypothetical protein